MTREKVNEPAPKATSDEPEYRLTMTPQVTKAALYGGPNLGDVFYRAILRYGDEVVDDWKVNTPEEGRADAVRKKRAHKIALGNVPDIVMTLGDDDDAA